jgi:hypothetical protein
MALLANLVPEKSLSIKKSEEECKKSKSTRTPLYLTELSWVAWT